MYFGFLPESLWFFRKNSNIALLCFQIYNKGMIFKNICRRFDEQQENHIHFIRFGGYYL